IQFMTAVLINHTPRAAVIEQRMISAVVPSSSRAGFRAKENGTMNEGIAILKEAQPVWLKSLPAIEAAAYEASATGGVGAASTPEEKKKKCADAGPGPIGTHDGPTRGSRKM